VVEGGAGCQGRVYGPDMEAAREVLETALAELVDSTDLELAFPMVGEHFADELRVICD
jgi:thiamine pyrophosphokinase